jgi:hypothetical protein
LHLKSEKHLQKAQLALQTTIKGCQNIMKTGMKTFNENQNVAVSVWKVCVCFFFFLLSIHQAATTLILPVFQIDKISVILPLIILNTIETHGTGVLLLFYFIIIILLTFF